MVAWFVYLLVASAAVRRVSPEKLRSLLSQTSDHPSGPTTLVGVSTWLRYSQFLKKTSGASTSTGSQVEDLPSRTDPPVSVERRLNVYDGNFVCEVCGLSYKTARGLGQHKRHRHPVELNDKRLKLLQNCYHAEKVNGLVCIADSARQAERQPEARALGDIAEMMLSGRLNVVQARARLTSVVKRIFPDVWTPQKGAVRKCVPKSQKARRRVTYARLQSLFKRKRKEAAKCVLDGQWKELWKCAEAKPKGTMEYWKAVLGAEAHLDTRPVPTTVQKWSILSPITSAEVTGALKESVGSSPGMDKKDARELLTWKPSTLAQLLNLFLVTELPPRTLSRARIPLIPKTVSPASPGDYRPIAISLVVLKLLHKLLFRRWRRVVKLESIQFALQERDGCLEASSLLNAILHSLHDTVRPIAAGILDISKAFDRAYHDTILQVAQAHGAPMSLVRYLRRLYSDGVVNLNDEDVKSKRGMGLKAAKSAVMIVEKSDKRKTLAIVPGSLQVGSNEVKCLGPTDTVKYLGLRFNWKGRLKMNAGMVFQEMLVNISKAAPKPYQKLVILKEFATPRLQYELVLGSAHRNTLKALDVAAHHAVRAWLRLPKDTPLGFFYAKVKDGGLGPMSFATTIPLLQRQKFQRIASSPDAIVRGLLKAKNVVSDQRLAYIPVRAKETL
ncbi:zinc finger, C2H2 type, partial [Opisthorchis viverrini]